MGLGTLGGALLSLLVPIAAAAAPAAAPQYGVVHPAAVLRQAGSGALHAAQGSVVAVSADGATVAVGAHPDGCTKTGAPVRIWVRDAGGWTLQATISDPVSVYCPEFGSALSLSADGRHLAVGDSERLAAGHKNGHHDGAVLIYDRAGSVWTLSSTILDPGPDRDSFGSSVALDADGTAFVAGAVNHSDGAAGAYAYARGTDGSWRQTGELGNAVDAPPLGFVGAAVAISADGATASVGASLGVGNVSENVALTFRLDSDGSWEQTGDLAAGLPSQGYGTYQISLALSGDGNVLAVGTPTWDAPGFVRTFRWSGTQWTSTATIASHNSSAKGQFGASLALSQDGSTLAVGAPARSNGTTTQSGGVYRFRTVGAAWTYLGATYIAHARTNEFDGDSVALSADAGLLIIGAPEYSTNGDLHTRTGAAYVVGG